MDIAVHSRSSVNIMVLVYKTDVEGSLQASAVQKVLLHHFPGARITIDLEDCDRVLRIEGTELCEKTIHELVNREGFQCLELD